MPRYHGTPNGNIQFTAEEEAIKDAKEKAWNDDAPNRKLNYIKQIRLQKLLETDWWVLRGDITDAQKLFRKNLRDIPTNYDSSKYDELLDKDSDGNLTHTIWEKP